MKNTHSNGSMSKADKTGYPTLVGSDKWTILVRRKFLKTWHYYDSSVYPFANMELDNPRPVYWRGISHLHVRWPDGHTEQLFITSRTVYTGSVTDVGSHAESSTAYFALVNVHGIDVEIPIESLEVWQPDLQYNTPDLQRMRL